MDTVFVHDLRVETIVGVLEWERRLPQAVRIDVDLAADTARAAASDELRDSVDYGAVADGIRALVSESRCRLIETLAESIACHLLETYAVPWVAVTVRKPGAVGGTRDVGVRIERGERR